MMAHFECNYILFHSNDFTSFLFRCLKRLKKERKKQKKKHCAILLIQKVFFLNCSLLLRQELPILSLYLIFQFFENQKKVTEINRFADSLPVFLSSLRQPSQASTLRVCRYCIQTDDRCVCRQEFFFWRIYGEFYLALHLVQHHCHP